MASLNGWSDVDRLLFPVKLGPELQKVSQDFGIQRLGATHSKGTHLRFGLGTRAGMLLGAWALLLLAGCGYQPVYASSPARQYEVTAARSGTASFEAAQAAVGGVRTELAAADALGSGADQLVVEVLRVDERSIGVHEGQGGSPLARGAEIVVVGRARAYATPGGPVGLDTGDMSRSAQYAAGDSPTADAAARSRAVRDASRALGRALGRAILGLPEPAQD